MMRAGTSFILLCLAFASAIEILSLNAGVYDYHRRIGIPQARKIKEYEAAVLSGQRVAGGSATTILSVPYQAGIIVTVLIWTSMCGGTIIADHTVLTAAHCYSDGNAIVDSITVVLGSNFLFNGGTRITDATVTMHPGYNPWIAANDIAVVRVPHITFSPSIQPVNLPSGSQVNNDFVGITALGSGFGVTNDGESISPLQGLTSTNLQVISNDECHRVYQGIIQDHHLCTSGAGGVGMCVGDTGGPLVAVIDRIKTLIGVSSFRSSSGCHGGYPSGFIRVTSFLSWINSI